MTEDILPGLCKKFMEETDSSKKKDLLLRIHNIDEVLYREYLARWFIDDPVVWGDVVITGLPRPPQEMVEYYALPKTKQRRMTPAFWSQPVIEEYLNKKAKTIARNKHWYKLAHNLLEWLPSNDYPRRAKVNERIAEMKGRLKAGGLPTATHDVDVDEVDWEE